MNYLYSHTLKILKKACKGFYINTKSKFGKDLNLMETDIQAYKKIFSLCANKLDLLNEPRQIKEYLILALDKTLGKVKQGTLSPALYPVIIARDLNPGSLDIAYELAAICAFFHTAADLTDDVQDEASDNLVINLVGKYQAINLANKMVFICQNLITNLKIADKAKLSLLKMFSGCGNNMCNGQYYDIDYTNTCLSDEESLTKITLINQRKGGEELACFLAALPAALGQNSEQYYKLGVHYGSLIQLFSDYINIWGKIISDDLLVLKNSLPIFAAYSDPVFKEEVRTLFAGTNDLADKQYMLQLLMTKTKAVEEFETFLNITWAEIGKIFAALPELPKLESLVNELFADCAELIKALYDARLKGSIINPPKRSIDFNKSTGMALDYLKSNNYYEDTWEVQRWGFLKTEKLIANIFPPALILETLLEAGIDISNSLDYLLSLKGKESWHYYSNTNKIPTDTDDLGQLLNLAGRNGFFRRTKLFQEPLELLEQNIEISGKCPTWMADQHFSKDFIDNNWFGNECAGVMANLYYGLFMFDPEKYRDKIFKGANYIINQFDFSKNCWTGSYYTDYYTFYLVCRLLNALDLQNESITNAKNKILEQQKLNGSWNNSAQNTASALLGLLTFKDINPLVLKTGMIYLHETQKYDGSWDGENLFLCPGRDGRIDYYKHPKVTSSFCLRALLQGQGKLQRKLQSGKRLKIETEIFV